MPLGTGPHKARDVLMEELLLAAAGGLLIGLLLTVFGGGGSVLVTPWLIYVVGVADSHLLSFGGTVADQGKWCPSVRMGPAIEGRIMAGVISDFSHRLL